MPPQEPQQPEKPEKPPKPLEQIVEEVGLYPIEAYEFIHSGLAYTVQKIHGERISKKKDPQKITKEEQKSFHVTGRDLSQGLREFALLRWGMLARTVLRRWNITRTEDFGRIVFALVENGHMSKTENDTLEDFKNVFDFATAFDDNYRIPSKS